jgi:hypothetical protein
MNDLDIGDRVLLEERYFGVVRAVRETEPRIRVVFGDPPAEIWVFSEWLRRVA